MKTAFVTESSFIGNYDSNFLNARTEIAWQIALDAIHYPITEFNKIRGFDLVIIIWPKLRTEINVDGHKIANISGPLQSLVVQNIVATLKLNNKLIAYMQEGPSWFMNDYDIPTQVNLYNQIAESDIIFCHNEYDLKWYKGMFGKKHTYVMPSLMIETLIKNIVPTKEDKVIIGGNFARWYGGFQSYIIAREFNVQIDIPSMHNKREYEDQLPELHHLSYMNWYEWMQNLSKYKYAIHMMPTVAAGTFSLNCSYFGIPCISNELLDTQKICQPDLAVDVNDIETAKRLAIKLKEDVDFYNYCSKVARENYNAFFTEQVFKDKLTKIFTKIKTNGI
jgi:hypothetical protein